MLGMKCRRRKTAGTDSRRHKALPAMTTMRNTTSVSPWFDARVVHDHCALRLFCVPHAGATGLAFRAWHRLVPESIAVLPLQLPGRGPRLDEPSFRSLLSIVEAATEAIFPLLDRPFALFGHSVGAAIAFELARRMEARGYGPQCLFVAGRSAPPRASSRNIHTLPRDRLIEALRELDGMSTDVLDNPDALDVLLPILRADLEVSETYQYLPGPPLHCPIMAFGGTTDILTSANDIRAWRRHTQGRFSAHIFGGGHFFVHTAQTEMVRMIVDTLLTGVQDRCTTSSD